MVVTLIFLAVVSRFKIAAMISFSEYVYRLDSFGNLSNSWKNPEDVANYGIHRASRLPKD